MKALALRIKKYWQIFWHLRRMRVMQRMAYNVNFFIMAVGVLLQMVFSVVFVRVIFGFVGNLAGWSYYEALAVVASYMILEGLMWVLCAYLGAIGRLVKEGAMDSLLIKPIDAQFLVSVWQGDPEDAVRLVSGAAVLLYAWQNLDMALGQSLLNLIFYAGLMVGAFLILYSIVLVTRSLAFWLVEVRSLHSISDAVTKMSQYPTNIFYHAVVRLIFSTLIPLAFLATVPAKIFIHGFDWQLVGASFLVAAIFFYASRQFWLFAVKHYSSASG
jgi:ABC-2 type transport system permease protein